MNVITDAEFEEARTLGPDTLRRYLSGKGWRADRELSGTELWERYVETEPDQPYEVLVPAERRRDYPGRVADILETLALVEARPPADILREMRLPPSDWQFLRLVPPGPSGTAPLLDLVSALSGLRELHTAAASSALTPQRVQPGQKPQAVKDHVAAVRLDQTRVGSYVVAAHTPLPPAPDPAPWPSLFDDDAFSDGPGSRRPEPFPRTVSRTLFAGVTCAHAAAEETLRRDSLADFASYADAGLSANLCEALVKIAGEERRRFSLSFAWSSDVRMEQASPPVELTRAHLEVLEVGAKDLREKWGREPEAILHGVVTRLSGQGNREATVYGTLLHEDDARTRSVRVDLRPEDVDKATRAWRHGLEVAVKGDLGPYGTGLRMRQVLGFAVREG
ncbi:hypothetical protein [Streptomyces mayonensis]|uniref:hypothetical protein n=1 Tax=Streptomyces mayonensis TaxID=2750816 RepID=UPI001C1DE441|nr:hypothetical protein [Streptomyces sp. A108]MBU6535566.1 hypothetical protein [Streptomyces sp. A108]